MIVKNSKFTYFYLFLLHVFHFYNYFFNFFNFFFFKFFNKIIFFFKNLKIFKFLKKKININLFFFDYTNKNIKKNLFFLEDRATFFFSEKNNFFISTKKKTITFKNIFFYNFLFFFSTFNSFYKYNHNFNYFFFKEYKKKIILIDTKKIYNRWEEGQSLIFNIFYYDFNPLLFGSFEYKNEILSINWYNFNYDYTIWRYFSLFFIFKVNKYMPQMKYFLDKIFNILNSFIIVSNPVYHYKNLHYFSKFKIYTVSLINSNLSPWVVSYPIPALSINFLIEYCFLKLLMLLLKTSLIYKYNILKLKWVRSELMKILK